MTYLLTRAYSNLAMDGIDSAGNEIPPVLRITTMTCIADGTCRLSFFDDTSHTFVAATGEIISSDDALRPDWTTFTDRLAKSATFHDNSKLMCLVRSQDEKIFEKGISKAFRTRLAIHPDNMLAGELLAIAESYVLANVAVSQLIDAFRFEYLGDEVTQSSQMP